MSNPVVILAELETELLVRIVGNLAKGNIGSAEWQASRLAAYGRVSDELAKEVAKGTQAAKESMTALLNSESRSAALGVDSQIPKGFAGALPDTADNAIKATFTVWDEIAATQLNQTGANLLISSRAAYIDIVDKTAAEVLTGVKTGREAIADISRGWSQKGLPALLDNAGKEWTTEAYAQTIVRSNTRNVITGVQDQRMEQWGVDLVEISSHVGAREGCEPYQGKVYSRSGDSTQYPPLSSTSMGEIDGLFGINCQHNMGPYFPGTKKTNNPVPLRENRRAYENSQKQRGLERSIRRSKRELDVANAAGDVQGANSAQDKITGQQGAMRQFLNETGRTRQRQREQI